MDYTLVFSNPWDFLFGYNLTSLGRMNPKFQKIAFQPVYIGLLDKVGWNRQNQIDRQTAENLLFNTIPSVFKATFIEI